MNFVLFESHEVDSGGRVVLEDRRAIHIFRILRARVGDRLRVGILGGAFGVGEVIQARQGYVELQCRFEADPPRGLPVLDLLVAMPRPKAAARLLSAAASFAVRRVTITGARRVEPTYFDAHVLKGDAIRRYLVEGCEQGGCTRLPDVEVLPTFSEGLRRARDAAPPGARRVVGEPGVSVRIRQVVAAGEPVLLAVGPDGGWTVGELKCLEKEGFQKAGMAGGALRTDTACVALMALVRDRQAG